MAQKDATDMLIPHPFEGVFSEIITKSVGFGATKRKEKVKKLWFVERDEQGATFVRPLNREYLPAGERKEAELEAIVQSFFPEPNIYIRHVKPMLARLEQAVDQGDDHRAKGELLSAEFSYNQALEIDEFHIRANFGMALNYLEMGDRTRARHTFRRLVTLEGAFQERHKHLFNEFGIALRRSAMYKESLEYYQRALALSETDEHLFFNLARACYDNNDLDRSKEYVGKALELNPGFREGVQLAKRLGLQPPENGKG